MNKRYGFSALVLSTLLLASCAATHDLAHYPYPEAQAELREVLNSIIHDAQTANAVGLREGHLISDKFTKFGGRLYERLDFEQTVAGETGNITTGKDFTYEVEDLKIDVFDDVAIMTYYGRVKRIVDGKPVRYSFRQTLVFLNTSDGWKIIHEHQSRKEYAQ